MLIEGLGAARWRKPEGSDARSRSTCAQAHSAAGAFGTGAASFRPTPLLAQTPRLKFLSDMIAGDPRLDFHLSLDSDDSDFEITARLLDGLLDTLESFFGDERITLTITCCSGQAERIASGLIHIPRLDLEIIETTVLQSNYLDLFALMAHPALRRGLDALVLATRTEPAMTLSLTPTSFPVRSFSARDLAACCSKRSWHERLAPLARRRREAPLSGPALFSRDLAVAALARLNNRVVDLARLDERQRTDAVLAEIAEAELGFWAPESTQTSTPLIRRSGPDELAPWKIQPWLTNTEPHFLWLNPLPAEHCERALRLVYQAIYR